MRILGPAKQRAERDITVKRRRHTPEKIVRKLREVERLLGEGRSTAEAVKQVEVSEQTYYRWRNQYGAMAADDARRRRELERVGMTTPFGPTVMMSSGPLPSSSGLSNL